MRRGVSLGILVMACNEPASPPLPHCPSATASAPASTTPSSAPATRRIVTVAPSTRLRFFPDHDLTEPERLERRATAVVLFSPPPMSLEAWSLYPVGPTRLQPILCAIDGRLEVGLRCGEAMPPQARARLTTEPPTIATAARPTKPFVDTASGRVYPAPRAPACCMYNTCLGETIPYDVRLRSPEGDQLLPLKTLIGVWPPDADVGLDPHYPAAEPGYQPPLTLWKGHDTPPALVQHESFGEVEFLSTTFGPIGGQRFMKTSAGWVSLAPRGQWESYLVASFDVDDDGTREWVVLAKSANDYGLYVYIAGNPKPIYEFDCGNV